MHRFRVGIQAMIGVAALVGVMVTTAACAAQVAVTRTGDATPGPATSAVVAPSAPVLAPSSTASASSIPSTSPSATPPPPGGSTATPQAVINAFLAFTRPVDAAYAAKASGSYSVGSQAIRYDLKGTRAGGDVVLVGTETLDGDVVPWSTAVIGDHMFTFGDDGWTEVDAAPTDARLFGDMLFSLRTAIVLEDLGPDAALDGYRLRVAAPMSLYPPQVAALLKTTRGDDRLELVVDEAGRPLRAEYTLTVPGASAGDPPAAQGSVTWDFSCIGPTCELPSMLLAGGKVLPPSAAASPSPSPAWSTTALTHVPLEVSLPGRAAVTTTPIENEFLGLLERTSIKGTGPSGAAYSVFDLTLPASYIADQGVDAVAAETVALTAKDLDGAVVAQRTLTDGPAPGVEALIVTATTVYRTRAYVFDDAIVQLLVAGPLQQVAVSEADAFLSSLAPGS